MVIGTCSLPPSASFLNNTNHSQIYNLNHNNHNNRHSMQNLYPKNQKSETNHRFSNFVQEPNAKPKRNTQKQK